MFKNSKIVIVAALATAFASTASAWTYRDETSTIATKSIPFQLTNGDRVEQGVVKYDFYVQILATQTGSASTWDHPIDNRQCTVNAFSGVIRNVCFTTILGEQSCHNKWSRPLPQTASYTPVRGNFLDHDPCSDYHHKMDDLKRQVTVELTKQIDAIYEGDMERLRQEWAGVGVDVDYSK